MDVTWFLAQQEPTNLYAFFLQLWNMKQTRFFSFFPPLLGKHLYTFSHAWCHDISWSVPLEDSTPFIDTILGSIPHSTLHVDYTSTPLALAGSSHKKGPDALGTCRTTLVVITVNLESLEDFFPQEPSLDKFETLLIDPPWLYLYGMEEPMPRMKWKNQHHFIHKPLNFGAMLHPSISYKTMVIPLHTAAFSLESLVPKSAFP